MLGLSGALALFYVLPLWAAANPQVDEAFRRTFITREFGAYPTSPVFGGGNGLAYQLGRVVVFDSEAPRLLLSRYDWRGRYEDGALLTGWRGRVFLHLEGRSAVIGRSLRLSLGFTCGMPAGETTTLTVSVNATAVGALPCRQGAVTAHFTVPAGVMGVARYDEISITRTPDGFAERVKTRLGLRYQAVALTEMLLQLRP